MVFKVRRQCPFLFCRVGCPDNPDASLSVKRRPTSKIFTFLEGPLLKILVSYLCSIYKSDCELTHNEYHPPRPLSSFVTFPRQYQQGRYRILDFELVEMEKHWNNSCPDHISPKMACASNTITLVLAIVYLSSRIVAFRTYVLLSI